MSLQAELCLSCSQAAAKAQPHTAACAARGHAATTLAAWEYRQDSGPAPQGEHIAKKQGWLGNMIRND